MHNKFFIISEIVKVKMREKTIDCTMRATWQAVSRMYNEEAAKFKGSISVKFTLLKIEKEGDTPSTASGPKIGM